MFLQEHRVDPAGWRRSAAAVQKAPQHLFHIFTKQVRFNIHGLAEFDFSQGGLGQGVGYDIDVK